MAPNALVDLLAIEMDERRAISIGYNPENRSTYVLQIECLPFCFSFNNLPSLTIVDDLFKFFHRRTKNSKINELFEDKFTYNEGQQKISIEPTERNDEIKFRSFCGDNYFEYTPTLEDVKVMTDMLKYIKERLKERGLLS